MGASRAWDRFTLSSSANITSIDAQLTLNAPNLNYSIWTADRSTQLFSQTFDINGRNNLTMEAYRRNDAFDTSWSWNVSAPLTGLSLAAGDYYLSIYGGTGAAWLYWWFSSVIVDGSYLVTAGHSLGQGRDLAFRINGTYDVAQTPIPAALPLFGTGLGLMGLVGWWRSHKGGDIKNLAATYQTQRQCRRPLWSAVENGRPGDHSQSPKLWSGCPQYQPSFVS